MDNLRSQTRFPTRMVWKGGWRFRALGFLLGLGGLLACGLSQPRLVVILVQEGLTPEELAGEVPCQQAWMLWEPARSEASRALTLSTGYRHSATAEMTDLRFASAPYEHGTAGQAFRRRTGRTAPPNSLVALGAGALQAQGILQQTFASRVERWGKRGEYFCTYDAPPPSLYALMAIGSQGYVPVRTFPDTESMRIAIVQSRADWVLVFLRQWRYRDWELLVAEGIETWLVSLHPPKAFPEEGARPHLTGVVRYSAREPRGLLTSASTRWAGLIHATDLTPTLVYALTRKWDGSAEGALVVERMQSPWHRYWNGLLVQMVAPHLAVEHRSTWYGNALERVQTLWHIQHALAPTILALIAGAWLLWMGAGLVLWRLGWLTGMLQRVYRVGLAVWALFPAVSVWHGYYPLGMERVLENTPAMVGWLVGGWSVLGLLTAGLIRWSQLPPLTASATVALAVIGLDLMFAGGYGNNRSLLNGLAQGSPLYGLSDLSLGFVMGLGVLAPADWLSHHYRERFGARGLSLMGMGYGVLLLISGLPMLGANALAWVALTGAFGLMVLPQVLVLPSPLSFRQGLGTLLALFGLGMGLIALNGWFNSQLEWHSQAVGWASRLGWNSLALPLNALVPMGIALAGGILCLGLLGRAIRRVWTQGIALRWGLGACFAGALFAVLVSPAGLGVASGAMMVCLLGVVEFVLATKPPKPPHEGNGVYHPHPKRVGTGIGHS